MEHISWEELILPTFPNSDEPGVSAIAAEGGTVTHQLYRGLADLRDSRRVNSGTNFRLASASKQFTAAAILLLVQRGALSLDSVLAEALPGFPTYAKSITIRQMLNHTSGLIAYESVIPPDRTASLFDADVADLMRAQESTYFEPGTQFRYSNTGYALLAQIVEKYSGKTFSAFLHDSIFIPLGMSGTVVFRPGENAVMNRAYGFALKDGAWVDADQNITTSVLGDGGIYSNPSDYLKWDAALYTDKLLPQDVIAEALRPGRLQDGSEIPYGYGWRLRDANNRKVVYHTGSTSGFNSCVSRIPELRKTFVILVNRSGTEAHKIARDWELWATSRHGL